MKKAVNPFLWMSLVLLVPFIQFPVQLSAQEKGTFVDKRDGKSYSWVKIGNAVWLNSNLKHSAPSGSWFCNNDSSTLDTYGRLYDWATAMTSCPKGWHLPSDAEWSQLVQALGGTENAGAKYQEMDSIGRDPALAAKNPGFCSLYAGIRHTDGLTSGIGLWGGFWSSTITDAGNAKNILFAHGAKGISQSSNDKGTGLLVRCVKKK